MCFTTSHPNWNPFIDDPDVRSTTVHLKSIVRQIQIAYDIGLFERHWFWTGTRHNHMVNLFYLQSTFKAMSNRGYLRIEHTFWMLLFLFMIVLKNNGVKEAYTNNIFQVRYPNMQTSGCKSNIRRIKMAISTGNPESTQLLRLIGLPRFCQEPEASIRISTAKLQERTIVPSLSNNHHLNVVNR